MPYYTATVSRHAIWAWHYSTEAGCTVIQLGRWIIEIVHHTEEYTNADHDAD